MKRHRDPRSIGVLAELAEEVAEVAVGFAETLAERECELPIPIADQVRYSLEAILAELRRTGLRVSGMPCDPTTGREDY